MNGCSGTYGAVGLYGATIAPLGATGNPVWTDPEAPAWRYEVLPNNAGFVVVAAPIASQVGKRILPGTAAYNAVMSRRRGLLTAPAGSSASAQILDALSAAAARLPGSASQIPDVVSTWRDQGAGAGAGAAIGTGTSIAIEALQARQQARGSEAALRAQLVQLTAQYQRANTAKKRATILAKIRGVQAALASIGAQTPQAPPTVDEAPPFPFVPVAIVAVVVIGAALVLGRKP